MSECPKTKKAVSPDVVITVWSHMREIARRHAVAAGDASLERLVSSVSLARSGRVWRALAMVPSAPCALAGEGDTPAEALYALAWSLLVED